MTVMTRQKGVLIVEDQSKSIRAKIRKKNQVTLNQELLNAIGASEGDELEWKVVDGALVGVPTMSILKNQAWYFTPQWQKAEQEVEEELANGGIENVNMFNTAQDLLKQLKSNKD